MYFNIRTNTFLTDADLQVMGIRSDSPNLLTSNMLVRLNESAIPTPGDYERVQEILPTSVSNPEDPFAQPTYFRAYEVVDMFPADTTENDPITGLPVIVTIQEHKDRYLTNTIKQHATTHATDARRYAEKRGLITESGVHIDTSSSGLSRLMLTKAWSDANPTDPVTVITMQPPVEMSRQDFLAIVIAATDYIQAVYAAEASLRTSIAAATSPADVRDICCSAHGVFPPCVCRDHHTT